ncbi:hypothetical protein BGZ51_004593, partial [Haplosporangium sp. Z 767]
CHFFTVEVKKAAQELVAQSDLEKLAYEMKDTIDDLASQRTKSRLKEFLECIVYSFKEYDLILGKSWCTAVNLNINWRTNDLYFDHKDHQIQWTCCGFAPSPSHSGSMVTVRNQLSITTEEDVMSLLTNVRITRPTPNPQPNLPDPIQQLITMEFPGIFPLALPDCLPP